MNGFDNIDYYGFFPVLYGVWSFAANYFFAKFHLRITEDYVEQLQYNEEEDLLFVTTNTWFGAPVEKVYEMHHLEYIPPY